MNTQDGFDGWNACNEDWAALSAKHNEEWEALHAQTNANWSALHTQTNKEWLVASVLGYGWGLILGLVFGYCLGAMP